ncbi:hypothetical protein BCR44DRAFT_1035974 [Catenaria anguillulae PL171]|uniref:Uncharacterized protein n=1 Tax=Catenaria anguillulae PL171 TaxID=765915 RepID=A0A1Y2HWQ3_9FUNG|nr:hypothetical protein BCR44DRAFT_1035974 [Catenaria anguillulae PL171]
MFSSGSVPTQHLSEPSAADQALVDALLSTAADLYPALQPTASAVPDPDLFAFLSAVPEDELQAMLTAADAVLDEDDDDHAIVASAALPASSLPMSAFQSPMPQPEDRLLTDEDEDDDTSSLPDRHSRLRPPTRTKMTIPTKKTMARTTSTMMTRTMCGTASA